MTVRFMSFLYKTLVLFNSLFIVVGWQAGVFYLFSVV